MRWVALATLAACGRIGFGAYTPGSGGGGGGSGDPFGDGGTAPADTVALEVRADVTGAAIAGATVLVDRGGGTFDRLTTGSDGTVAFTATAPVTAHVVYQAASTWRVYSLIAVPPQTAIVLGGRPVSQGNSSHMTVDASAIGNGQNYGATLPARCGPELLNNSNAALIAVDYEPACEGATYPTWILVTDSGGVVHGYDGGMLTLASKATVTVTGTYSVMPSYAVQLSAIPAQSAAVDVLPATYDAAGEFIPLGVLATVTGSSVTLQAPPLADTLQIYALGPAIGAYTSQSSYELRGQLAATTAVDGSQMLPQFAALSLPASASSASWSFIGATARSPQLVWFEATIASVQWTAYGPGSTTSIAFPQLPADLAAADPAGQMWFAASVEAIATSGGSYASLVHGWDPALSMGAPPGGDFAMALIDYSSLLGPP